MPLQGPWLVPSSPFGFSPPVFYMLGLGTHHHRRSMRSGLVEEGTGECHGEVIGLLVEVRCTTDRADGTMGGR